MTQAEPIIISPEQPGSSGRDRLRPLKTMTTVIYALQAGSFFVGVTLFVAIIFNYIKRDEVRGTWLESHFRWQIRTFWYGMLWTGIGIITYLLLIGYVILFANYIWMIYRVAKGWLNLAEGRPMDFRPYRQRQGSDAA
jgi:uncharacterized membrane protein